MKPSTYSLHQQYNQVEDISIGYPDPEHSTICGFHRSSPSDSSSNTPARPMSYTKTYPDHNHESLPYFFEPIASREDGSLTEESSSMFLQHGIAPRLFGPSQNNIVSEPQGSSCATYQEPKLWNNTQAIIVKATEGLRHTRTTSKRRSNKRYVADF